jgi:hypothetical protein
MKSSTTIGMEYTYFGKKVCASYAVLVVTAVIAITIRARSVYDSKF